MIKIWNYPNIIFVIPCKEHEIKPGHWNCEHEQGFLQKPVLQRAGLLPAHLRSRQNKMLIYFYYLFQLTPLDVADFEEFWGEYRRGSLSRIQQTKFLVARISVKFQCKIGFLNGQCIYTRFLQKLFTPAFLISSPSWNSMKARVLRSVPISKQYLEKVLV